MVQSPEPRFGEECFTFVISSMVLLYWLFIPSTAIILFLFSFFLFFSGASLSLTFSSLIFLWSSSYLHARGCHPCRCVCVCVCVCFFFFFFFQFGMSRSVRHHEG
ncbi:hypothetical protein MGG_17729 [Pyricularia oryzae 70-15]|uniref:Uncharacterized protein n=1 Tax=Pyricularia oryzae (strain 70-15 / ATCC MYA-4617 / FGSC 8958) TaxID=242507 RepID=G4NH81_PYRO7|nr:uncharacterized protein MGG_17729 [Pyricularia oryzae 70-15]EHA47591.1 hypothetical protein MGG_17729 [Pyricularia oryzae 70-15]